MSGDGGDQPKNFPSFSEGLSLRVFRWAYPLHLSADFPSFSEGLSLRGRASFGYDGYPRVISLPFRRDFH